MTMYDKLQCNDIKQIGFTYFIMFSGHYRTYCVPYLLILTYESEIVQIIFQVKYKAYYVPCPSLPSALVILNHIQYRNFDGILYVHVSFGENQYRLVTYSPWIYRISQSMVWTHSLILKMVKTNAATDKCFVVIHASIRCLYIRTVFTDIKVDNMIKFYCFSLAVASP